MGTYVLTGTESALDLAGTVEPIFDIAGKAITMVTENPLLLVYFAAGLIFIGIAVFKKVK